MTNHPTDYNDGSPVCRITFLSARKAYQSNYALIIPKCYHPYYRNTRSTVIDTRCRAGQNAEEGFHLSNPRTINLHVRS